MSITRVGIIGSGIMGAGIAEVAAATGHEVVLRSRSTAGAEAMVAGLARSLAKQVEKGKRTEEEATGSPAGSAPPRTWASWSTSTSSSSRWSRTSA